MFVLSLVLAVSLEMLDKVEPPSIPEGYAMSVAFSALLDLVRGITAMIESALAVENQVAPVREGEAPVKPPLSDSGPHEPRESQWESIVHVTHLRMSL